MDPGEPDNVARLLAVLSLILALAQWLAASQRQLWRRRSSAVSGLRVSFDELKMAVEAAREDARGAANLWTGAVDFLLGDLGRQLPEVPDLRLRRYIDRGRRLIIECRGMTTPPNDDALADGIVLTAAQHGQVDQAMQLLGRVDKRMQECVRKGGRVVST